MIPCIEIRARVESDATIRAEVHTDEPIAAEMQTSVAAESYRFGHGLEYDPATHEVDIDETQLDYDLLQNHPSINGTELIGNKTSADLGIDQTYVHNQDMPSSEWEITHNLGKFPSVTIVDSAGTVVVADVQYINQNSLTVSFAADVIGTAYLN